jgi:YD repeat-containing protein
MKIKILITAIAAFYINYSNAQHTDQDVVPNFTPAYPATASLGNFGNIPVGLNTGKPNINLEIFNLKEGSISVPISINYSSSGVAVDGISSQLGIDWSLIASGVVSRQVNDEDDFVQAFYSPDPNTSQFCVPNSLLAIGTSSSDTEKDVFNYSAFGISGKFIFNGTAIVQINPNKNKIELLNQTFSDGSVHKTFKITDTSGTEFYFGDNETAVEKSRNRSLCGSSGQTQYQSGWYLTKIKKNDGSIAIFKYSLKDFEFNQAYSQDAKARGDILISPAAVGLPCVSSIVNHTVPYLTEIDINDKKIIFDYQKLDTNTPESEQLTKITVFKNATDVFKSFEFGYDLLQRNSNLNYLNDYTTTAGLNTKLIYLKEVKEFTAVRANNEYIKKYAFEYYSPDQLPPRFSFSKDIYGYFNGAPNSNFVYNNLTPDSGDFYTSFAVANANRDTNANTVYFGMLKNIIYPTKGKTELVYEPNSIYIDKKFFPPSSTLDVAYQATGGLFANITLSDPIAIPFNQTCTLNGSAEFYPTAGQTCTYALSHGAACTVEIINAATNAVIKSIAAQPTVSVKVDLLAGTTYKIRVTTAGSCISTYATLVYHKDPVYTMKVNEPVAGVRVKKTLDYDDNGKIMTKKYYYGSLECLDCSTGYFATQNPAAAVNLEKKFLPNLDMQNTMYSSPKHPLSSFDGIVVSYSKVIESYGENFENGGVLHDFDNNMDEFPAAVCDEYIRGASYSNGFCNGEISNMTFRKVGNAIIPVSSEEMTYDHNTSLDLAFNNFFGGLSYTLNTPTGNTDYFYNFNIFQIRSQWHYLSQKKSIVYDLNGLNPVTTTTNYYYNNPNHLQLTSQTTTSSDGKLIENKYFYAQDTDMSNKPFISDLIAKNIVGVPLDTQTFKAGNKLSEKLTVYENSASTSSLVLPKSIYAAKFPNAFPVLANLGNVEKKITFDKYDDKGNIQQYTLESGSSVTFIWGYGRTQPSAKIENATIAQVTAALGVSDLSTVNESNFTAINNLRTGLPNAMITTYSYIPLVGVSTIIDPKGYTTTYTYDNFNRLQSVKDQDGKILSENQYHYKN